jgi:mycothione reductase
MLKKFDIIIIGSGGGSKITRPAAALGYRVAIIDHGPLGGTCLNRGCIPSKMLIHVADVIHEIKTAKNFYIDNDPSTNVDVASLVKHVSDTVDAESQSISPMYEANDNITLYTKTARFLSNKVIQVGTDEITADKIFICAGGRPFIPEITGLKNTPYWTSTEALRAKTLPKSLIILGGGYIAVELGYYFQGLGVDVTFVIRNQMIKDEDDEIIHIFKEEFGKNHRLIFGCEASAVSYDNQLFNVVLTDKTELQAEQLLVATGIQPNSDVLDIKNTDIQCDDAGFITVNKQLETHVSNIYAFGDIIRPYQFRHSANFEGQYLFDHVVKQNDDTPIKYAPVPHAIFTNPQVAGVGLTERECKRLKRGYYCGKNWYKDSAMGMALKSENDFVKLIFDSATHELIGAHIIGQEAATMIHMCILAMSLKATHHDLVSMIYIHPALPEVVRNAARNAKIK